MWSTQSRAPLAWLRVTVQALVLIAAVVVLLALLNPPPQTRAGLRIVAGPLIDARLNEQHELLLYLDGTPSPFYVGAGDMALFDLPAFTRDVAPGTALAIGITPAAASLLTQAGKRIPALDVRGDAAVYLAYEAVQAGRFRGQATTLPLVLAALLLLLAGLVLLSVRKHDYRNLVADYRDFARAVRKA